MAWVRFDPGFTRHPKRLAVDPVANWLWVSAVDYCAEHLTDGFLPERALNELLRLCFQKPYPGSTTRQRLVIHQLTDSLAFTVTDGGYIVNGFLEYQDSAEDVRNAREAGKQRAKASRARRAGQPGSPERQATVQRTDDTRLRERSLGVRTSAVLSCPVSPPTVPPNGQPVDPTLRCTDGRGDLAKAWCNPHPDHLHSSACTLPVTPATVDRVTGRYTPRPHEVKPAW